MKIQVYGYSRDDENSERSLDLREVSFVAEPDVLRRIAEHLCQSAEEIERYGEGFDHLHLRDEWEEWEEDAADVIVVRRQHPVR